ncbi:MAG: Zn-ribbon domain-containing protein [Nanoarchaeota archaeon]|nr:Zn-ribbon domain-containing protein [Nanoarchaeota archaeon]
MPHQCVRCGKLYDDGSKEILTGCLCGAKLFFYIKKDKLEQAKEIADNLSNKEKKQIEKDVYEIMGRDQEEEDKTVVLDLESIRVIKPGKFELDLVHLFNKKEPLVYKLDEGKYIIDVAETFKRNADSKKK